jgi:type III secretion protein L
MSLVIKAVAARDLVRPLGQTRSASHVPAPEPPEKEDEALRREIEALRAALVGARTAAGEAETLAREEGRREGAEARQDADAERFALLDAGIGAATSQFEARLLASEQLALALARAALAKLFDQWEDASELVTRTLARQLANLRRESVLAVRVSAADFPDESARSALAARAATGSISILADPDLQSGGCRLDLQVGHLDLGLETQWLQLSRLLGELAGEGVDA